MVKDLIDNFDSYVDGELHGPTVLLWMALNMYNRRKKDALRKRFKRLLLLMAMVMASS